MTDRSDTEEQQFQRILRRNVILPLILGVVSAAVFVALILYLLSVMRWVEHSERVIGDATDVTKMVADKETGLRGFLITGDETFLAPYRIGLAKMPAAMAVLSGLVADNPPQVERLARIQALQAQWNRFAGDMIALRRSGGDFRSVILAGRGKVEIDEIRREFNDFFDIEMRLRRERGETANLVTGLTIVLFLAISLIISAILALVGRRELMRLSSAYSAALQHQKEHAETLERQAWLRAGQTSLSSRTVGQMALLPLGEAVLGFLADYVGAVVAALYVRDEAGALSRCATYGFSRASEQTQQVFSGGESLVGQAAKERRIILLDDVPNDYVNVNSGLGAAPPRYLTLVPLDNNGRVRGVLELGFLHAPSARESTFLELVAGNIGASIEAAVTRQREQDLLSETQQLNEELQTQQEELRAANEELSAQSQVLEESRARLQDQKAELEQTNEQLSTQAAQLDEKNATLNETQAALEDRASELQKASQYKSEFLANMSHELRTPLNSSLILAKLLSENVQGNLTDEQVKFAQAIYSSGNDLLILINDILDISKVEAGQLDLALEEIPLSRLIETLKRTFEPLARQRGLLFSIETVGDVPSSIFSDSQRIEQVLKNLLSNAFKFTERGSVVLTISRHDGDKVAAGAGIRFAVRDSGIGIAADQQDKIFEAFRQADGTISRRYGGTGLGLSISRDLAALMQGFIDVTSVLEHGSTFTLVLPERWVEDAPAKRRAPQPRSARQTSADAAPAPGAAATAVERSDGSPQRPGEPAFADDRERDLSGGRTALVIEDDPGFARILYDLAHEMRYLCLVAHNADDGLQLAAQYAPVAILLDLRLPDRSGLSVLQRLKDDPATRHIPVHVVSAAERTDAALHLGAIGYAVKPATQEQLRDVFRKLEVKFTQKMKRILLVEDDARQRESVVQLIGDDDIDIEAVESGEEALSLLRTSIFDCMIIDLKLPDMQGSDLLRHMAAEKFISYPPAIVYTGRNLSRDEELDLLKYSRSIIIKGARSPERLLDEVTLFLHKVETDLSPERQAMLKSVRGRDRLFEGRRILLVDDDVRNIFALTSALEQKGAVVEIAREGAEAINKLERIADIDLVLMDVMMPGMDGLEATRRIRRDPRFEKTPIIVVTAKARKEDQELCFKAGATDYVTKPVDLERLYSLLRVWMPSIERI